MDSVDETALVKHFEPHPDSVDETALVKHFEPHPWQRIGTKFLLEHPRGMLVADPGLGKTAMTFSALDLLQMGGSNFFPALVIAPKRVTEVVWTTEAEKWDVFQHLKVTKITGAADARMSILQRLTADVYVINYDLIPWLTSIYVPEKWPFKIVVADESSRLKGFRLSKGGMRAKALSMVARFTGRWWNLTGTPTPNGLQDLWGQMWFVDFGKSLKRSYTAYLEAYFLQNPYSRKITPQQGAEETIQQQVSDSLIALRAEDWLPLTKPQQLDIMVDLPPKARAQYRELEKEYFLSLPQADIDAGTAAVASQKTLQFASGSVYDGTATAREVHGAKIEALADIVEQTGDEPLLVAYHWKFDKQRILKAFPEARVYEGKETERAFNAGKIKLLLLHAQSAFGLNLAERCRDIVWYSYYWNAELWQQMIDRVGPVRQYQLNKSVVTRVWVIRVIDTIESEVIDSNYGKITVEQAFKRARARRSL